MSLSSAPRTALRIIGMACLALNIGLASAASQSPAAANDASAKVAHPGVDALIGHLHDSLKIEPAQEPAWQKVATIMRENAAEMARLAKARADKAATATAVDDLKSYADLSAAHARDTRRLLPAFTALYDSMSPEQKKAADEEFRGHYREHHRPPGSKP